MSCAAWLTTEAYEPLSELPMRPTRLILSANIFKQHQKFLIARRPFNRRLGQSAPAKGWQRRDEFFQLTDHSFVNDRISDDSGAKMRLCLAGLKLWLDQRQDFTGRS